MANKTTARTRRWIMIALTLLIFGVFASKLLQIQIVHADKYQKSMDGVLSSSQMRKAVRGEIMDRDGNPIVVNEMGHSVILDRPFLPTGTEQNDVILRLITMMEHLGEEWIDNLPITVRQPYQYLSDREEDVQRLQTHLDTQSYATAEEIMYWLVEPYDLKDYTPLEARKLAGVRYEMERRDFSTKIPYTFAEDISIESVIYLKERNFELPGVTPESKAIRKYAVDDFAPHILGQVGPLYAEEYAQLKEDGKIYKENAPVFDADGYTMDDIIGKGGIEEALEDILRGSNGKREITTDATGEVIEYFDAIPPVPGSTVYLTLDKSIQRRAQDALEAQINFLRTAPTAEPQARDADAGAVAAIQVKTGEILALASYPTYTLTDYRNDYQEVAGREGGPLVDRAVGSAYAPGSIYKPVTAITALQQMVATPTSTFHCGGVYEFFAPTYRPRCLSVHGNINVVRALRESCNIYFYEAGRLSGIEALDHTAKALGLGEPTGIEITENIGQRSNPETKEALGRGVWYPADTVQTAIGQFDSKFSPLQLANYAATIANRGKRMKLSLVHQIRDYAGENVLEDFTPTTTHTMDDVPQEVFEAVIQGMVEASHLGTARGTFANYPVSVASKTGTPEIGNQKVNSTFMAFAPAEDPEIAVVVVIEKGWHGYTGASVAKSIFDEYFGIEDVWAPVPNGPDQMMQQRIAEAIEKGEITDKNPSDYATYQPREELEQPAQSEEVAPVTDQPAPALPEEESESTPPVQEEPPASSKEESVYQPPEREGEADVDINPPPSRQTQGGDDKS